MPALTSGFLHILLSAGTPTFRNHSIKQGSEVDPSADWSARRISFCNVLVYFCCSPSLSHCISARVGKNRPTIDN